MTDNSRKTKIVNPTYQYRAAFTSVLLAIILINVFILTGALAPDLLGRIIERTYYGYYLIGIVEVFLIYIFWKKAISATHRVAGPVFAIDRELRKLRDQDLTFSINLRPRDQFQEAVTSINANIGHLRDDIGEIKSMASALTENCTSEELEKLRNALEKFKTDESDRTSSTPVEEQNDDNKAG